MTSIGTNRAGRVSNPSIFKDGLDIRPQGGFTLLEVTVVLVVLGVFAAVSWPLLRPQFQASRLQSAAKQMRTELAKARHKAMETGVVQHFHYQPGEGCFEIAPSENDLQASFLPVDGDDEPRRDAKRASALRQESDLRHAGLQYLPEGIRFAEPELELDAEDDSARAPRADGPRPAPDETAGGRFAAGGPAIAPRFEWAAPIAFYPDGRTSNARIRLECDAGSQVEITLRGLTGVATIGPLRRPDAPEQSHFRQDRSPVTERWHHAL